MSTFTQVALEYQGKPWTTNAERKQGHWSARAALVQEWRQAFCVIARSQRVPRLAWAWIDVEAWQAKGRLQDTGACHPAVKAAVDGLVDAGVIPDDSPEYLRRITFNAPKRGRDALVLHVRGPIETVSDE